MLRVAISSHQLRPPRRGGRPPPLEQASVQQAARFSSVWLRGVVAHGTEPVIPVGYGNDASGFQAAGFSSVWLRGVIAHGTVTGGSYMGYGIGANDSYGGYGGSTSGFHAGLAQPAGPP